MLNVLPATEYSETIFYYSENVPENNPAPCPTCGHIKFVHPIKEVRELPEVLQTMFITPNSNADGKATTKKRKLVLESRMITGSDFLGMFKVNTSVKNNR